MRKLFGIGVCLFVLLLLPVCLLAEDRPSFEKGKINNLEAVKQALETYAKQSDAKPDDYEAAWKAARECRYYADYSLKKNVPNWKSICKEYGKMGMKYGEKAIALKPNAIEGNFWYGCCVGSYSDGVSILTALREGLKDKTQKSFEKAYQIDKSYWEAGPPKALGRFWFVLPWPLQDKKLSVKYLKEAEKLYPNDPETQTYLGETLLKTGDKDEAKAILEKAATSTFFDNGYYAAHANKLLGQ